MVNSSKEGIMTRVVKLTRTLTISILENINFPTDILFQAVRERNINKDRRRISESRRY